MDVMVGFAEYFDDLDDPRLETKIHHPLLSVLMIAVLGVLCGAEGWADLAIFAKAKHPFLATFLDLPHGPPRKDTFRRVFEALEPNAFRCQSIQVRCFVRERTVRAQAFVPQIVGQDQEHIGGAGGLCRIEREP